MGWGERREDYNQYQNFQPENKAEFSHELIGGGAAFGAMKLFEDHQRKEGKPVSHQFAKELLAGFVGAEVDRFAETKGEDWYDREKVKRHAQDHAEQMYDEHYGGYDQYDPNQHRPHRELQEQFGGNGLVEKA